VIQGQAQLLLRQLRALQGGDKVRRSAESILTASRRMNVMIMDLVDSARTASGQLKLDCVPTELGAAVLSLKERLSEVMETSRVRVEIPDELPPVLADPDRLERILTNLISNALKYSSPGTEVVVRLSAQDTEVVTRVIDHGPGIPPEELPNLFQRYARTREAREHREGLGLGLYITKHLVEAHGGRIWVESGGGEGEHVQLHVAGGVVMSDEALVARTRTPRWLYIYLHSSPPRSDLPPDYCPTKLLLTGRLRRLPGAKDLPLQVDAYSHAEHGDTYHNPQWPTTSARPNWIW